MENKINIIATIKDGAIFGFKNFPSILVAVVLYVLTCWIPWLNVGTTVGMCKIVIELSKGKVVDPTILFKSENWDNLGNLFLFLGLAAMGLTAATVFMAIPGIILSIAWSFAIYFLVDRKMKPVEALELSYKATKGEKWRIVAIHVLATIAVTIVCTLFGLVPKVGAVLAVIAGILCVAIILAIESVMFKHFNEKV